MPLREIEIEQKKLLRYLIRDFYELRDILEAVKKAEREQKEQLYSQLQTEIKTLLRRLRGRFFAGEERIEYRLARQFKHLQHVLQENWGLMEQQETSSLATVLEQAAVYNAELERLGSRNGEIEKALKHFLQNSDNQQNLSKIKELVERALEADMAFEVLIKNLKVEAQKVKTIKGSLKIVEQYESLAVITGNHTNKKVIILFDRDALIKEVESYRDKFYAHFEAIRTGKAAKEWDEIQQFEKETKERTIEGEGWDPQIIKITYLQHRLLEQAIIGFCELIPPVNKHIFLNAYEIRRIAARKGYGPFLFELAFAFAAKNKLPVILDREEVSTDARKVWEYFDLHRRDVLKYPACIRTHPEKIGITLDQYSHWFGPQAVGASTFDRDGFPTGTPAAKKKEIYEQTGLTRIHFLTREEEGILKPTSINTRSYLERERTPETNPVVGGLASLDKAYYSDKEMVMLDELVRRGKEPIFIKRNGVKEAKPYYDSGRLFGLLYSAGFAFFQRFSPHRK